MDGIETPGSIVGKIRKVEHYSGGDLTQITLDDKVKCSILLEGDKAWPQYTSLIGIKVTCSYNSSGWDVQRLQLPKWKMFEGYLKPSTQYETSLATP